MTNVCRWLRFMSTVQIPYGGSSQEARGEEAEGPRRGLDVCCPSRERTAYAKDSIRNTGWKPKKKPQNLQVLSLIPLFEPLLDVGGIITEERHLLTEDWQHPHQAKAAAIQ